MGEDVRTRPGSSTYWGASGSSHLTSRWLRCTRWKCCELAGSIKRFLTLPCGWWSERSGVISQGSRLGFALAHPMVGQGGGEEVYGCAYHFRDGAGRRGRRWLRDGDSMDLDGGWLCCVWVWGVSERTARGNVEWGGEWRGKGYDDMTVAHTCLPRNKSLGPLFISKDNRCG